MIVVAIIVLLIAILLPAINAARRSAKVDKAQAQMQMIAMAIDEYARFWPPVKLTTGKVIAAKGLPPFDFGLICDDTAELDHQLANSDSVPDDIPVLILEPDAKRFPALSDIELRNRFAKEGDIYESNECLAWCLTANVGNGPYLKQIPSGMEVFVPLDKDNDPNRLYITPSSQEQKRRLVDPWGTPYFYCWATADGAWVLLCATNPQLLDHMMVFPYVTDTKDMNKAHKFILLSAGPDKQFYFLNEDGTLNDAAAGPDQRWGTDDDLYNDDIVLGRGGK
ncbi:MAG: hypothetical protein JXQ73_17965 [Phycisphaerae bacterium]|nr:hypothetical protein [Phycisphaerae bacterium]